jgi:hypothetical protein
MSSHFIDHYQFGEIIVDGVTHSKDLILLPDRVITGWWRLEGHLLHVEDLAEVLKAKPGFLVIGKGAYSRMRVAPEVEEILQAAEIGWVALPTGEACREYNQRAAQQAVAAALHLTC